jgi:hypothetical protein
MKPDCLEILARIGPEQEPQRKRRKGEYTLVKSYDASNNKIPPEPMLAESLEEIQKEIDAAKEEKYDQIQKKYLWAIKGETIFIGLEKTPVESERGCICHTNLTGGTNAIIGGELWFLDSDKSVRINFKSGRYPLQDADRQIPEVVNLFKCVGYTKTEVLPR